MKNGIMKCSGLLMGLGIIFLLLPQTAATIVWEDNFDDGNYDGWTVTDGSWAVVNGNLTAVYDGDTSHQIWSLSSQVVGTWSFDVFLAGPQMSGNQIRVGFMGNGTDTATYFLTIQPADTDSGIKFELGNWPLGYVEIDDFRQTCTHIDITRNSAGEMYLYVNKTGPVAEPDLAVVSLLQFYLLDTSDRFVISSSNSDGSVIDNIVVNDEILITPPATTTPETTTTPDTTPTNGGPGIPIDSTLLIVGAGVGGVVIIAAVVCMRRR
ncbi:MAG: hypothetical protein ACFFEE_12845 [Candidatus Thorarchaeota archaeon]